MQSRITLLVDHDTREVTISADNLPDGQEALYTLLRAFVAGSSVVCDQLEDKRLVIAKAFKPMLKI